MKKVFSLIAVEVKPLKGCQLLDAYPKAKGAVLSCIVCADSPQEARQKGVLALERDHYHVKSIREVLEFTDCDFNDEELETTFKAMAWDALMFERIGYGPFYNW